MKTVLFATTALVALAGAASAQTVSWSGSVTTGYNDAIEGGLFLQGDIGLSASVDLGDNVTAEFDWAGVTWDNNAASALSNTITATITYTNNNMTASLRAGDLNDKGASEYFYKDRDGMAIDVENQDGSSDVRALLEFGSFGVAVGCSAVGGVIGVCDGLNVGAGATFGSIELGIGYDDAANAGGSRTAVSADATFGSLTVGASYITAAGIPTTAVTATNLDGDDTDNTVLGTGAALAGALAGAGIDGTESSIGVSLGYEISSSLSVDAYYANNSVAGNSYGVSANFTSGALSIAAYYDVTASTVYGYTGTDADGDGFFAAAPAPVLGWSGVTATAYGADLSYGVSDAITAYAGVKVATTTVYYAGVEYNVNDNITATLSYATANEISGPEFKDGITAMISAEF